jgi:outer membrane immunogenic protein
MKKAIFVAASLTAAFASSNALAGDLPPAPPYGAPPPYAPQPYAAPAPYAAPYYVYSWVGPYIGLNLGYQWGTLKSTSPLTSSSQPSNNADPAGFVFGGQVGFNWQSGHFVYGFEADLQASNADTTFATYKFSNPWFGTVRGRAGYTFNNILLYGTAGLALAGGEIDSGGVSESNTHVGWAAGAGMEVGFTPNWSAKAEYLFMDLSSQSYVVTGASHGFNANILRFGVNYRF